MLHERENPSPESGGPRSQTTFAYEAIRSGILGGRHSPDSKLKIQDLAKVLDVSPGAVREALSRLVPEGLVVSRDQRGFIVAPLSVDDLVDLTDIRCEIEAIALRRSVARGDINWEANILAAEHRLRSKILIDDNERLWDDWARKHANFHRALVSACGNSRLLAIHANLYEQSDRYRGLTYRLNTARNVERDVGAEHHEIVARALERDTEGLVQVVVDHIRKTTELIIEAFGRSDMP